MNTRMMIYTVAMILSTALFVVGWFLPPGWRFWIRPIALAFFTAGFIAYSTHKPKRL